MGLTLFQYFFQAAEYLGASAVAHGLATSFPIYQVRGVTSVPDDMDGPASGKYIFIGVVIVLVVGLLFAVIVATRKKRKHGITWFPEGFLRANR